VKSWWKSEKECFTKTQRIAPSVADERNNKKRKKGRVVFDFRTLEKGGHIRPGALKKIRRGRRKRNDGQDWRRKR